MKKVEKVNELRRAIYMLLEKMPLVINEKNAEVAAKWTQREAKKLAEVARQIAEDDTDVRA